LARDGRDHARLGICFCLSNQALKGEVGFALPPHSIGQALSRDPGKLRRGLAIAPAAKGVENPGSTGSVWSCPRPSGSAAGVSPSEDPSGGPVARAGGARNRKLVTMTTALRLLVALVFQTPRRPPKL